MPQFHEIPNVVGRPLDVAAQMLAAAGFAVGRITREPSNEAPGTVTAQAPKGGTLVPSFVPSRIDISLTVAVRMPEVRPRVPNVVGQLLDDATPVLVNAGFTVGRITRESSNEAPGTVTAQTPEGGTVAPIKAPIALTVAVRQQFPVPDVVGQSFDDAGRTLAEADFTVGRVTREPSNEAPGTVIAQTPEAGAPAQPRTGVALRVAIPLPQDKARVPDVVGESLDDARRTLAEAGFAVGRVTRGVSNETAGTVTEQAPPGGTPAPLKTAIGLTVAIPQPPPRVPDVVGRPQAEAARILAGVGFTVGHVTLAPSNEAPGIVIAQTPEGGTPAQPRTGIALTVAIPQPQDKARVPDVVGRSLDDARRTLAATGFTVGRVTRTASNEAPGIVTKQAPVGETVVGPPLPAVDLTLAAVKVPGVVGQVVDPAKSALERANFTIQATLQPSDRPRGTVTYQDPGADALVIPPLPVVKVTVAAAEVPSVVGRSLDVATRMLGDAGFTGVATGWPQVPFFARVVDQKPAGGTFITSAQAVVTLTVRMEAGRWLPAIVGFLLGVGGSIAASKVRARTKPAPRLMRMKVSRDLGTQEIRLGAQAIRGGTDVVKDPDVRLKPVSDPGDPDIERPENVLPTEEGDDHA